MALKAKIAKLEDVVEAFRGEYTKGEDGAYYLAVDGIESIPAVVAIQRKREEVGLLNRQLKEKYDGVDIDDLKAAKVKLAELEAGNRGGKNDEKIVELTNTVKQLTAQAASEKAALEEKVTKAVSEKDRYIRKAEIVRELQAAGGNPTFLEHHLEPMLRVVDGKVVVVDDSGNPRIKNSMNEPLTLKDVIADLKTKPEFGGAFASQAAGGSGASGGSGGGSALPPGTVSRSSPGWSLKVAEAKAKGQQMTVVD